MIRSLIQLIVLLTGCLTALFGQNVQALKNPSFESDLPNVNTIPQDWGSFSSKEVQYPDLLPGEYVVKALPQHGVVFVGLRTYKSSAEGLVQQLTMPLRVDSMYQMSIWLSHASIYIVPNLKNGKQIGTTTSNGAAHLKVMGVNAATQHAEVLAETAVINHGEWKQYTLLLNPQRIQCDQIILTATKSDDGQEQGNLLMDHCSDIVQVAWSNSEVFREDNLTKTTVALPAPADQIIIKNPSFDDNKDSQLKEMPQFWEDLGFKNYSPPDIQPGFFSVRLKPKDGEHYLGMVARANGTREAVGQKLSARMEKKASYAFSIWLAMSREFEAMDRNSVTWSFTNPVLLQIWGVNTLEMRKELLVSTNPINHFTWRKYDFTLTPEQMDIDYIVLQVWYDMNKNKAYNGHLLLDHCSDIVKIDR